MTDLLLQIAEITLSMSAIILITLALSKVFGAKFSAKCRYIVWAVIILRLCIPVGVLNMPTVFTLDIPFTESRAETNEQLGGMVDSIESEKGNGQIGSDAPPAIISPVSPTEPSTPTVPSDPIEPADPVMPDSTPLPAEPVTPAVPDNSPEPKPSTPNTALTEKKENIPLPSIQTVLFALWITGAAVFFAVNLAGNARTVRSYHRKKELCGRETAALYNTMCKKYNFKRDPRLYICPAVESPLLCGFFSPAIMLPRRNMSKNAVVGVLAHELTHYRRGDIWIKLACLIAQSICWFNPLVHIAAKRCNSEMELSCDECVLADTNEDVRRSYGKVMLEIIRNSHVQKSVLTTRFNPQKSAVKERFINILDMSKKRRGYVIIALALILCMIAGTIIGCEPRSAKAPNDKTEQKDSETDIQPVYTSEYIQVYELSALPQEPSEAWETFTLSMGPTYYFYDKGLTYYCTYEYNGEHFEKNTLTLPEGYTNGEIFLISGTGGSASMYINVKTDQGYLRYYIQANHYPDEVLSVTELTEEEVKQMEDMMASEGEREETEGYLQKPVEELVETGYQKSFDFYCTIYDNSIYNFHIALPSIAIDAPGAKELNGQIISKYTTRYAEHIKALETESVYSTRANVCYTATKYNDNIVILYIRNNTSLLGTGGVTDTFDIYYYDIFADKALSHGEFLSVHTGGEYGISQMLEKMNAHDGIVNRADPEHSIKAEDIYGIIPAGNGAFYAVYQGYIVEGAFASGAYFKDGEISSVYTYNKIAEVLGLDALWEPRRDAEKRATAVEELDSWGLPENNRELQFIRAFVSGDIDTLEELAGVKKGMYEAYRTMKIDAWVAYTEKDKYGQDVIYFCFYPSKVNTEILTFTPMVWNGCFTVRNGMSGIYLERENERYYTKGGPAEAAYMLFSNVYFQDLSKVGSADFNLTCHIVHQFDRPISLSEFQAYALEHFGIENFMPDGHSREDGMLIQTGHGGTYQAVKMLYDGRFNDEYFAMAQYYADVSMTVKSHTYNYYMKQNSDGEWIFTRCEEVSHAEYEPYRQTM